MSERGRETSAGSGTRRHCPHLHSCAAFARDRIENFTAASQSQSETIHLSNGTLHAVSPMSRARPLSVLVWSVPRVVRARCAAVGLGRWGAGGARREPPRQTRARRGRDPTSDDGGAYFEHEPRCAHYRQHTAETSVH